MPIDGCKILPLCLRATIYLDKICTVSSIIIPMATAPTTAIEKPTPTNNALIPNVTSIGITCKKNTGNANLYRFEAKCNIKNIALLKKKPVALP